LNLILWGSSRGGCWVRTGGTGPEGLAVHGRLRPVEPDVPEPVPERCSRRVPMDRLDTVDTALLAHDIDDAEIRNIAYGKRGDLPERLVEVETVRQHEADFGQKRLFAFCTLLGSWPRWVFARGFLTRFLGGC